MGEVSPTVNQRPHPAAKPKLTVQKAAPRPAPIKRRDKVRTPESNKINTPITKIAANDIEIKGRSNLQTLAAIETDVVIRIFSTFP